MTERHFRVVQLDGKKVEIGGVSISSKAPFGLVGSPKFNPSVRDIAFPPKTEIFLHASAILISAPILGSKYENLERIISDLEDRLDKLEKN